MISATEDLDPAKGTAACAVPNDAPFLVGGKGPGKCHGAAGAGPGHRSRPLEGAEVLLMLHRREGQARVWWNRTGAARMPKAGWSSVPR